jgi:pimeloyl-ACP methyl ester carboxylesterase
VAVGALVAVSVAQAEEAVDIPTRPDIKVRVLLERPAQPVGSVVLLAGGHGNLDLGPGGKIGWGGGNQLVRSRAGYARAGFVTAVPDVAPDLKEGSNAAAGYRWSENHARDIGAIVTHLRAIAQPVYLVGTSRAALSVGNAAARLSGPERPDAVVITAGMFVHVNDKQPSVERNVEGLERITLPVLLVHHENDECAYTPASGVARFKALLAAAPRVDTVLMKGGSAGRGNPCEAMSHHGFLGLDDEVVRTVTDWLKSLRL